MSEYGKQKDLKDILEDLAIHCLSVDPKKHNIKIILSKKVVENFNKSFTPIEKLPSAVPSTIESIWFDSGKVEIFSDEENEIATIKESV